MNGVSGMSLPRSGVGVGSGAAVEVGSSSAEEALLSWSSWLPPGVRPCSSSYSAVFKMAPSLSTRFPAWSYLLPSSSQV